MVNQFSFFFGKMRPNANCSLFWTPHQCIKFALLHQQSSFWDCTNTNAVAHITAHRRFEWSFRMYTQCATVECCHRKLYHILILRYFRDALPLSVMTFNEWNCQNRCAYLVAWVDRVADAAHNHNVYSQVESLLHSWSFRFFTDRRSLSHAIYAIFARKNKWHWQNEAIDQRHWIH